MNSGESKSKEIKDKTGRYINVGSGLNIQPDYINLDNSLYLYFSRIWHGFLRLFLSHEKLEIVKIARNAMDTGCLIQHDCRKKLPFSDSSIDHILCSHFLEHVYPEEMFLILKEFYRVLKPGGTIHLIVPHLERFINKYQESKSDQSADDLIGWMLMSTTSRPSFRYRLVELIGFEGMKHRWLYDQKSLMKRVLSAGLIPLDNNDVPSKFYREDCNESLHLYAKKLISRA